MNLSNLRDETRELHEAAEALLPLTDPGLDRARYASLLLCFYRAVQGWENWAARHVPGDLQTLVEERRRAPLLLQDLRFLGVHFPSGSKENAEDGNRSASDSPQSLHESQPLRTLLDGKDPNSPDYRAGFLGAMYVMEGSTLGGQYIARHVEQVLGFAPGEGDAFFRGHGEHTGSMWNAFRDVLGAVPEEHAGTVTAAARAMFAFVQDSMRSRMAPPEPDAFEMHAEGCATP